MANWYVSNGAQSFGPMQDEQVVALIRQHGAVFNVCEVGAQAWTPIASHQAFAEAIRAAMPPALPSTQERTLGPTATFIIEKIASGVAAFVVLAAAWWVWGFFWGDSSAKDEWITTKPNKPVAAPIYAPTKEDPAPRAPFEEPVDLKEFLSWISKVHENPRTQTGFRGECNHGSCFAGYYRDPNKDWGYHTEFSEQDDLAIQFSTAIKPIGGCPVKTMHEIKTWVFHGNQRRYVCEINSGPLSGWGVFAKDMASNDLWLVIIFSPEYLQFDLSFARVLQESSG